MKDISKKGLVVFQDKKIRRTWFSLRQKSIMIETAIGGCFAKIDLKEN